MNLGPEWNLAFIGGTMSASKAKCERVLPPVEWEFGLRPNDCGPGGIHYVEWGGLGSVRSAIGGKSPTNLLLLLKLGIPLTIVGYSHGANIAWKGILDAFEGEFLRAPVYLVSIGCPALGSIASRIASMVAEPRFHRTIRLSVRQWYSPSDWVQSRVAGIVPRHDLLATPYYPEFPRISVKGPAWLAHKWLPDRVLSHYYNLAALDTLEAAQWWTTQEEQDAARAKIGAQLGVKLDLDYPGFI